MPGPYAILPTPIAADEYLGGDGRALDIRQFKYDSSRNLGDQIQSLAAEQFLPEVETLLDRDALNRSLEEEHVAVLNGWFTHHPRNWPPARRLKPVFIGFHITNWNDSQRRLTSRESLDYYHRHAPIGCRDRTTRDLLQSKGVASFYSKCLTLTFPRRSVEPVNGKVLIVDAEKVPIPCHLKHKARYLSHQSRPRGCGEAEKRRQAERLLAAYQYEAELVITTRLHSALPCLAMGVPVVFVARRPDTRFEILADLGLPVNRYRWRQSRRKPGIALRILKKAVDTCCIHSVNWAPRPLDIESEKAALRTRIRDALGRVAANGDLAGP